MKYSVIAPFLNEREFIRPFLEALLKELEGQTPPEVLLVDNGSVDGSREIAATFPEVRILTEPKRDPYLARNRGIQEATGEYILFLDADCAPKPGWWMALRKAMEQTNADILLGNIEYPEPTPALLARYGDYYNTKTGWLLRKRLQSCYYGHGGNMAVKRRVFEETGLFRGMPEVGDTAILHDLLEVRPDAQIVHVPDAAVSHLEVKTFQDCKVKLQDCGGYTRDYEGQKGFRTLNFRERVQIMLACIREHRYGLIRACELVWVLALGGRAFAKGRK